MISADQIEGHSDNDGSRAFTCCRSCGGLAAYSRARSFVKRHAPPKQQHDDDESNSTGSKGAIRALAPGLEFKRGILLCTSHRSCSSDSLRRIRIRRWRRRRRDQCNQTLLTRNLAVALAMRRRFVLHCRLVEEYPKLGYNSGRGADSYEDNERPVEAVAFAIPKSTFKPETNSGTFFVAEKCWWKLSFRFRLHILQSRDIYSIKRSDVFCPESQNLWPRRTWLLAMGAVLISVL